MCVSQVQIERVPNVKLTNLIIHIERVAMESGIIILVDFKVAYGDKNDAHAWALHDILSDANLRQNVTDASHQQGNVLDLVITAS